MPAKRNPRKSPLEREIEALRAGTAQPDSTEVLPALRTALASRHAMVIRIAAGIVAEHVIDGLRVDLEQAFTRLLAGTAKDDPICQAKNAVIEALDRIECPDPAPFLAATRCVQMEPGFGEPTDTAGNVRARGLLGLARLHYDDLVLVAADLLTDKDAAVRRAAAEAIEANGQPAGGGALLLKLRMPREDDPMVTLACLAGLVTLAPDFALPIARRFLDGTSEEREIATVVLGQSGRGDALDLLVEFLKDSPMPAWRALALRGLGYHRSERALNVLLETVSGGAPADAEAAIKALAARLFERGLRERTEEAARANSRADLRPIIDRAFSAATD
jgi:HEAT repeat protein